jgi:hypothetical protein
MQQVAAISMKVMLLCFVSHKVMTTPIPCVCFGLVTTNTTLLVTLPSCGGGRGGVSLCNQLSIVCISELVRLYMALY